MGLSIESIWSLVDQCLLWVQKQKVNVAAKTNQKNPEKPWGWFIGIIITIVIFFGLSILSVVLWNKGKAIAKLKHQQDVDREKRTWLKTRLKLELLEEKKQEIKEDVKKIAAVIVKNDSQIVSLESKKQEIREKIDAITSWEDVDKTMILFKRK